MANRTFNRKQSLEREIKELYAKITFGASGAPTLTTGHGIASITKTDTGDYRLTLSDKYNSLKMAEGVLIKSTAEDITFAVKAEAVSTNKTIDFWTLAGATPTSPSSGAVLLIKIEVKNSSVL